MQSNFQPAVQSVVQNHSPLAIATPPGVPSALAAFAGPNDQEWIEVVPTRAGGEVRVLLYGPGRRFGMSALIHTARVRDVRDGVEYAQRFFREPEFRTAIQRELARSGRR